MNTVLCETPIIWLCNTLGCKFKRSVSAPISAKRGGTASRVNSAHHGATFNIWC